MSNLSQFFGGGLKIKSIQRGTIEIAATATGASATISSVDTSKSILFNLGFASTVLSSGASGVGVRLNLTNETTVTASKIYASSGAYSVSYQVVEFE